MITLTEKETKSIRGKESLEKVLWKYCKREYVWVSEKHAATVVIYRNNKLERGYFSLYPSDCQTDGQSIVNKIADWINREDDNTNGQGKGIDQE